MNASGEASNAWRRNFAVVWAANFLTAVGMTTFLRLFPLHLQSMGVRGDAEVKLWSGALVAVAPLAAAFMGPVWGALGDRIGRKPMLLRANAAITFFVGLMWFAHSPWLLLGLRLLQGCFSGFIAPAMTLVSVSAPPERQGRVAGTLHTGVLAGSILGPCLGGFIGDGSAYRHAFLFCAATSLVALALIKFFVVEVPGTRRQRDAATAATAETVRVSFRHLLADAREFLAPGPLRTMVAGVFVVRGAAVLADPLLALFVPTLDGSRTGREGVDTGLVGGAAALATLLVTPIWGRRGDDRGHARQLATCGLLAALCVAPQAAVSHVFQLYALAFAAGVFLAGILPSAFGLAARLSPVDRRGAANGFMFSAIGLANALGPLAGGLLAAAIGIRPLYVIAGATMLAGSLWLLRERTRLERRAAATPPAPKQAVATTIAADAASVPEVD